MSWGGQPPQQYVSYTPNCVFTENGLGNNCESSVTRQYIVGRNVKHLACLASFMFINDNDTRIYLKPCLTAVVNTVLQLTGLFEYFDFTTITESFELLLHLSKVIEVGFT